MVFLREWAERALDAFSSLVKKNNGSLEVTGLVGQIGLDIKFLNKGTHFCIGWSFLIAFRSL